MRAAHLALAAALLMSEAALAQRAVPRQVAPPGLAAPPLERVTPLTPGVPGPPPGIEVPEAPAAAPPAGSETVFLTPRAFAVEGVTAYPPARIEQITAPLVGQRIAASEVFALAQRIERLYRDDGYFLTVVFVPRQEVADGTVRIRVVEGYIASIVIEGEAGPAKARIERILNRITESRPARIDQVERQLLLADDIPGTGIRTVLRRSASPGASDMVVQITHAPFDAVAAIDNRGSHYQGPQQAYGNVGYNSLTGLGDRLEALFFTTLDREQNFLQGNYIVPLTDSGLRLRAFGGGGRSEPGLDLRDIGYENQIGLGGLAVTYPLVRSRDRNLTLGADVNFYNSRTSVRRPYPLSGKMLQAQSDVRPLRFGLDGDLRDSWNGLNRFSLRFSKGLDIFNPTAAGNPRNDRPGSDPMFAKVNGEISRLQGVWAEENWSLNLLGVVAGQYTSDILPSSERFYLGGDRLGRGYYNGEVAGDRTIAGTLELQFNFAMINDLDKPESLIPIQLYAFYDVGGARNLSRFDIPWQRIASAGLGTRVEVSRRVGFEMEGTHVFDRQIAGPNMPLIPANWFFGRLIVRY
ncbi:MAG: ShlB/FhaC/HecB family hemolysin secretion/activation protein [Acetobacteraceae bacterium]|nr:ShlB/FhaC/HecB family hemolysin secretion/activation protein [Acetobacteraceae bacterium]